jgi:uncharacterized protein YegP (UPF0339 family)
MSTKLKPGIHLYKSLMIKRSKDGKPKYEYNWHIVASNGRIIARSSETYTRKGNAVKSIKIAALLFSLEHRRPGAILAHSYYDHSKKDSPLQSYL